MTIFKQSSSVFERSGLESINGAVLNLKINVYLNEMK